MKVIDKVILPVLTVVLLGGLSSCKKDLSFSSTTYALSDATPTSCSIRASYVMLGDDIQECGFLVLPKTTVVPKYSNSRHYAASGVPTDFTMVIKGLSVDTTYRLRMYAKSKDSIYYGSISEFRPIALTLDSAWVPSGTFRMGATGKQEAYADADEYPVHSVTLSGFWMGTKEVTNAQFAAFLKSRRVGESGAALAYDGTIRSFLSSHEHGLKYNSDSALWSVVKGFENHPMINVTWYGANEFCRWAGCRLPTEAEWEWAAKEAVSYEPLWTLFSGCDSTQLTNYAWYKANTLVQSYGHRDTQPVGTKTPNKLGIYDLTGNVWEWVSNWYVPYLSKSQVNPVGPSDKDAAESGFNQKIMRGGGWANGVSGDLSDLRVTNRSYQSPTINGGSLGFRIVKKH
jgi:formylglycine-generating enzyme required for sulfatase activity